MSHYRVRMVEREGAMVRRHAKLSWNIVYYSYDGGASWNRDGKQAYADAKAAGKLAHDIYAPDFVDERCDGMPAN